MTAMKNTALPPDDAEIVRRLCEMDESLCHEFKRVSNKMVHKALETIVAFANTEGGILVLGMEDYKKAQGKDRLYGIQDNPEAVDELRQQASHNITPPLENLVWKKLPCTLRDGNAGELVAVVVPKSPSVHSIVADGTWKRLERGNREMTAAEINGLSFARGVVSAEGELTEIPFELLQTEVWSTYCATRKLTSGGIQDRMFRIGLARKKGEELLPTKAAVLLFADDPSGILATKAAIRIFHYSGRKVEHAQPGAPANIIAGRWVDPDIMDLMAFTEIYDFNPCQNISAVILLPALDILFSGAYFNRA